MAQEPVDPVVSLLLKSPLTPAQRRAASEAFTSSANEDDLQERMMALNLPKMVRADLWDLKASAAPQPSVEAPQELQGNTVGRFLGNAAEALNPISMVKGAANAAMHPIDTAVGMFDAQKAQYDKAKAAEAGGNTSEMIGHSLAAAIPILGPMAAEIGEQAGTGDIAGASGKAMGLVVPYAAGKLLGGKAPNAQKADAMRREAESIVSDRVLAPANPKYKAPAQRVAPELLKRGVQGDRIAIQQWTDDLIGGAQQQIDDVIASYPATDRLPTADTLKALDDAMGQMQFSGANGAMQVNPAMQDAFNALANQRKFVSDLGKDMSFADMRRLRQQMDAIAKEAGAFSKAKGDMGLSAIEQAAVETGNAVRRQIAASRPELAAPNADMNLGLIVRDILDPAKGRPKNPSVTTGATGGLHTTAAIIGSHLTDIPGLKSIAAFVASDLIPRIKNAQISPENQLRLAQDKFKLAQALQAGKPTLAQSVMRRMSMYVPGLNQIGRLTTESTTPAGSR